MATISDELLSQFLSFTATSSEDVARQYLEMANGDLESAVGLFMEMGGDGGIGAGGGSGIAGAMGGISGGGSGSAGASGAAGMDDIDAATRQAIAAAQQEGSPQQIRAPDATRTMRLVGGDSPSIGHAALLSAVAGPNAAMMMGLGAADDDDGGFRDVQAMGSATWGVADLREGVNREAQRRARRDRNRGSGSGNSNDDAVDLDSDDNSDESDDDQQNFGPTSAPSLSTMFSPPTHLMHRAGGFQGARNMAKDARRWLLVNVQSDSDFACHALNRDVWRDELVENLVREGFIFWQVMSTHQEGQTYITRYKVQGYPHLAILDPRTGSLLWKKEGWTQVNPLTAEQFVEIASDFCSRHSFDKVPLPAKHRYSNSGPAATSNKRPIQELSEEEQLQAAIRASMMPENDDNDDMDEENEVEVLDKSMEETADSSAEEDDSKPAGLNSFEQEILSLQVPDEPASGNVARIQIRMPDGKRLVRKFNGDDSVKVIYAFVAQSNPEAKEGKSFELKAKFPPQDLLPSVDESISSCGLSGEAINVMWK